MKNLFYDLSQFRAFCGGRWGHYGYGMLRMTTGMGGIGCFMVSFVLVVEQVGSRFTSLIGVAIEIPFALGQVVLGLEAYFVRDWRALQILAHLPLLGNAILVTHLTAGFSILSPRSSSRALLCRA